MSGTETNEIIKITKGQISPIDAVLIPLSIWIKIDMDLAELSVYRKLGLTDYMNTQANVIRSVTTGIKESADSISKSAFSITENAGKLETKFTDIQKRYETQIKFLTITTSVGFSLSFAIVVGIIVYALLRNSEKSY